MSNWRLQWSRSRSQISRSPRLRKLRHKMRHS